MDTLIKDLRYGIRSFLKRPGFLVIAVSTLALGIGATTAMFTVVNSVLLRPLQFPDPERIVLLDGINPRQGITESNVSVPDIGDWQQQAQSFAARATRYTEGAPRPCRRISFRCPRRIRSVAALCKPAT